MKVIVTSWMFPNEMENGCDERPKSIERLSTSIEDLKSYMEDYNEASKKTLVWADNLWHLNDDREDDEIKRYYNGDGYAYLKSCLDDDSIGWCVCKLVYKTRVQYFTFQVRNLH